MFTQCPDCNTTFRVSNEVLQQAEGRVRCGGCGNAFNALENMADDESEGNRQDARESTSDQNKQLLDTLDKLAGPDVTLEDTGVEWRVLKKAQANEKDPDATGSMRFVLDTDEADSPAMLGRQEDVPKQISDAQESLDLPETDAPQTSPGERRYDDNTILPEDFGADDDLDELPFLEKPESPKRRAGDREAIQDNSEFDDAQVNLDLAEPDEWVDLLDEVDEEEERSIEVSDDVVALAASADEDAAPVEELETETLVDEPTSDEPPEDDMPSDINTQFLMQAEEMGIDTGNHPVLEIDDAGEKGPEGDGIDETDVGDPGVEAAQEDEHAELNLEVALALDDEEEQDEEEGEAEFESTGEFEAQIEEAEKALAGEDDEEESGEPAELELEDDAAASEKKGALTQAEEVEDAFASAIRSGKDVSKLFDADSPTVETIVMEGDAFGDALEEQARLDAARAASTFDNPGPLEDTYSLSRGKVRGGRRASDPVSYTVMASLVILILVLLAQLIHQSRQTLATYGAFNQTIGSIYRVLGKPVTPEWDVRGWQFEVTSNSVDEEQDLLTIYSRIANKSGQPLPYPLVHISLTDRWEDIIGSRVLEPNEYLAGDLDPSRSVPAGENFTAVITIESPSAEATGFKLAVCYRVAHGRVRCATQDFKN